MRKSHPLPLKCLDLFSLVIRLDKSDLTQTTRTEGTEILTKLTSERIDLKLPEPKMTCIELNSTQTFFA